MSYSDQALAFSTIPASHQLRLEDRVSFAYLEHANIVQDRTGVVALGSDESGFSKRVIQIPVGSMAVLALGPGTTISQAAMVSCTRSGATVLFTGGGGVPCYSHATPLTSSARWAIAQARLVSNERHQREAALALYKLQFGMEAIPGGTIRQMRGIEGQLMKRRYRELAQKHRINGFRRETGSDDDVNVGLNIGNSMLYGCAAAACAALGVSPALGIIHRGDARSLLFDLADLYKPGVVLPIAFASAGAEDVPAAVRRALRKEISSQRMLEGMLGALMGVLSPHLPERTDDRLVSDRGEEVEGHRQYGSDGKAPDQPGEMPE